MYQLLMNDAGILSNIRWIIEYFKDSGESTEAWYNRQIANLIEYHEILDSLFNVPTNQDYVADAYYEEINYDSYNGTAVCSFAIPKINMDSEHVNRINNNLYNALYPIIEDTISEINEYGYPMTSRVNVKTNGSMNF